MPASAYYRLKSFSYFDPAYSYEQFVADRRLDAEEVSTEELTPGS
jgi:hypothetical protein